MFLFFVFFLFVFFPSISWRKFIVENNDIFGGEEKSPNMATIVLNIWTSSRRRQRRKKWPKSREEASSTTKPPLLLLLLLLSLTVEEKEGGSRRKFLLSRRRCHDCPQLGSSRTQKKITEHYSKLGLRRTTFCREQFFFCNVEQTTRYKQRKKTLSLYIYYPNNKINTLRRTSALTSAAVRNVLTANFRTLQSSVYKLSLPISEALLYML